MLARVATLQSFKYASHQGTESQGRQFRVKDSAHINRAIMLRCMSGSSLIKAGRELRRRIKLIKPLMWVYQHDVKECWSCRAHQLAGHDTERTVAVWPASPTMAKRRV